MVSDDTLLCHAVWVVVIYGHVPCADVCVAIILILVAGACMCTMCAEHAVVQCRCSHRGMADTPATVHLHQAPCLPVCAGGLRPRPMACCECVLGTPSNAAVSTK